MLSFYLAMMETDEDRQFVEELYHKYEQMMLNITYSILQKRYDAEEAVHNVFMSIIESDSLQKMETYDDKHIEAYLAMAAKHAAFKIYNRRKKNYENSMNEYYADSDNIDTTEKEAISSLTVQEVKSAINKLSENDQDILSRHLLFEMSYDDISKELNITQDNVRQRIHRARKRLMKILEERGLHIDK